MKCYLAHNFANERFTVKATFVALVNVPIALLERSTSFLAQFWQRNELSIFNRFAHITV